MSAMTRIGFTGELIGPILAGTKTSTLRRRLPTGVRAGEEIELRWRPPDAPFARAVVREARTLRLIDLSARQRRGLEALYGTLPPRVGRIAFEVIERLDGPVPKDAEVGVRGPDPDQATLVDRGRETRDVLGAP
jgi:hypothetical protein